eukprot:gnl/TRDRNA2_/TRDRNA2_162339_c0_seq1.p1 gnl/TRDRNA2_/TRDRNA2_162339_c0~~gnl/TRDRNA2_/TRDRNA2_162339_c0_seq1.p1  ORF type:complete len:294 (-),score=91.43 gnl/TRDRNA2_/TRDRNA2_162339_c0_seq1:84-899(-)
MGLNENQAVFTMHFDYGQGFSRPKRDVFDHARVAEIPKLSPKVDTKFLMKVLPDGLPMCNFLHPVLVLLNTEGKQSCSYYDRPFHLMEDLFTIWDRPTEVIMLLDWFVTRVLSNPCKFNFHGPDARDLRWWWRALAAPFGNDNWEGYFEVDGQPTPLSLSALRKAWKAAWKEIEVVDKDSEEKEDEQEEDEDDEEAEEEQEEDEDDDEEDDDEEDEEDVDKIVEELVADDSDDEDEDEVEEVSTKRAPMQACDAASGLQEGEHCTQERSAA